MLRKASPQRGVYPRVCGGTIASSSSVGDTGGLSPRMRGNLAPAAQLRQLPGSIPAYAGEPGTWWAKIRRKWVYPRVCGGTGKLRRRFRFQQGLSPRMRGNQPGQLPPIVCRRSIPAYAGEPMRATSTAIGCGVYPRVCGGTAAGGVKAPPAKGLSPRMRGNLNSEIENTLSNGSIPAYAGEPKGG